MEGKSLSALSFVLALATFIIAASSTVAQVIAPEPYHWKEEPALFLEPNKFGVVKELQDRPLWLQVGFGGPIESWIYPGTSQSSALYLGLEGLAWSRLQTETDFRFPVETVDYFFGLYLTLDRSGTASDGDGHLDGDSWRLRISHISSHDVDGKDTVIGGSSSHYSREFIELMRQFHPFSNPVLLLSVGVRGYFHQVTKIEPWVAIPASISWRPWQNSGNALYLFASSGNGPVWPNIATGVRFERTNLTPSFKGATDLQLYYQYGASWAGTDAGAKRGSINIQMDVRGL